MALRLDGGTVHLLWLAVAAVDALVLVTIWRGNGAGAAEPVRLSRRRDDAASPFRAWALPLALAIGALAWFGVLHTA